MARAKPQSPEPVGGRTLDGFRPFSELWQGESPRFPSEQSCRWFKRQHGRELAEAGALAFDRGSFQFHPERFDKVRERVALDAAKARLLRGEA